MGSDSPQNNRRFIMKKTLKMAVSGALALTIVGGIATSASAAMQATKGSLVMYHNILGGPTKSSDSCTIERNIIDNSYYAECKSLYNAKPIITASAPISKTVKFTKDETIAFKVISLDEEIDFFADLPYY